MAAMYGATYRYQAAVLLLAGGLYTGVISYINISYIYIYHIYHIYHIDHINYIYYTYPTDFYFGVFYFGIWPKCQKKQRQNSKRQNKKLPIYKSVGYIMYMMNTFSGCPRITWFNKIIKYVPFGSDI